MWPTPPPPARSPVVRPHRTADEQAKLTVPSLLLSPLLQAEIDLFTEMCLDRSYNNINAMEEHFEYETLVSLMVNDRLPDQIRASFTLLLMRVWVDRYPHGDLMAPNPIQASSHCRLSRAASVASGFRTGRARGQHTTPVGRGRGGGWGVGIFCKARPTFEAVRRHARSQWAGRMSSSR